jgi:hypothetical protein
MTIVFEGLFCVAVLLLCLELASYQLIKSLNYVAMKEFPVVADALVEKFASFDNRLGHLPLPNSETFDRDITGKAYATKCSYNSDGARNSAFGPTEPALISTFGDSFCQCRGVEDEDTWQRKLELTLNRPIRNYGVGGHGLDQAHLRYLKLRSESLGNIIIFAVSPCTIERMVGVYKHYIEFGNILGLKPRYKLKTNGTLEICEIPIKDVSDIKHLHKYQEYFHKEDENYAGYFRHHSAKFPYSIFLQKHSADFILSLTKVLSHCCGWSESAKNWSVQLLQKNTEASRQAAYRRKNIYFKSLFEKNQNLFLEVVRQADSDCRNDGRRAILLLLPDYTNVKFMMEDGVYYRKAMNRIAEEIGMPVIDTYDIFNKVDPKSAYLKENCSGHHSANGNAMVAKIVRTALAPLLAELPDAATNFEQLKLTLRSTHVHRPS